MKKTSSEGSNGGSMRQRNSQRIASFGSPSGGGDCDLDNIPFAQAVSLDDYSNSYHSSYQSKGGGGGGGGGKGAKAAPAPPPPEVTRSSSSLEETPSNKVAKDLPKGLVDTLIKQLTRKPDEVNTKVYLTSAGWPEGMQDSFLRSLKKIPMRFFIVDDSGSMSTNDGRKIVRSGPEKAKMVPCTRWSELTDALNFHIELAEVAKAPTEFRLLNGADPVLVGMGDDQGEGAAFAKEVIGEDPAGQTPLCAHIRCVIRAINAMAPTLRANGQKAAVIICTDGESSDGPVAEAMRPLQNLPVWVVIRLATDEPTIVKYWDEIDKELELEMDVLDDLVQDAKQVVSHNPWLRYGDEMHRMREFGASFKELDFVDEGPLASEHCKSLIQNVLGGPNLPHPDVDLASFLSAVRRASEKQQKIFDPLEGKFEHWIRLDKLKAKFSTGGLESVACCLS